MPAPSNAPLLFTGVGCVSPYGIGRHVYVRNLVAGVSGLSRPDPEKFPDVRVPAVGACTAPLDDVLPGGHGRRFPRVVPLALLAVREALESAALPPNFAENPVAARRIGLILGTGGGGLEFVGRQYRDLHAGGRVGPYAVVGGTYGNLAGELSIATGLRGPSHVVSNGCASSADALGYAKLLIESGRLDAVVVGGADAPLTPDILNGFTAMGAAATRDRGCPAAASRPFSADRDGFVAAEGAWFFVLERAGWRENPPLFGKLLGYGSTCDAFHRVRISPDAEECANAARLAVADAGLDLADVSAVNLHGTGTLLNDRLETLAVRKVFGSRAGLIPTNATKSMIGHPQGAAGAAGVAAVLLCGREHKLHPTINLDVPDPECDLDYCRTTARPFAGGPVLCNSIAFGSKNSAVVVEVDV